MTDELIDVLFIDDHFTEIEEVIKAIRAAGFALRESHTKALAEIRQIASVQPPDLVFYDIGSGDPPIVSVRNALGETARVSPMLGLSHADTPPSRTEALQAGMRDLVSSGDLTQLVLVVEREMEVLKLRRRATRTEAMLTDAEARCDGLMDSSHDAIAFVHDGAHVYVNPAYLDLFGYQSREELEGLPIMNMVPKADRDQLKKLFRRSSQGKLDRTKQLEITGLKADQEEFRARLELHPATIQGETCIQVVLRPMEAEEALESQIAELRKRDHITGLYNRLHFRSVLDSAFAAAHSGGDGGTILYLLLNEYRSICERYSVTSGDDLIRGISKLLKQQTDKADQLCRFSEPTFIVLTPKRGEDAEALAESIRSAVASHMLEAGSSMVTTTCCIGLCDLAAGHSDSGEVIQLADKACEKARQAGGDRIEVHQPEGSADFLTTNERIEKALADDRLVLLFQPIATLSGQATPRFHVRPMYRENSDSFKEFQEIFGAPRGDGAQTELDRWTLLRCIERMSVASDKGTPPTLLVPITEDTLLHDDTPSWMEAHFRASPGLILTVREEIATRYFRQTQQLAQVGRKYQCGIAIDCFGSSQNSARLIDLLRPNYIRFHATLTDSLGQDTAAQEQMDELAKAVRSNGGEAIAGDIGNAHQLAGVWQTTLTLVEGDFLAPPSQELDFDFDQF